MRERGFALLIVLWTMALLALLGSQLVAAGRGEAQLARNLVDAARTEAATDGTVQQAIFAMLDPTAGRWKADGTLHEVRLGDIAVTLRLENENDRVNPNLASEGLLGALLVQLGATPATAESLAAAIAAWHSRTGAVDQAARYTAAGRDYTPTGANFRSLDEVGEVLGMTPDLLARLRPHMTVFSANNPDATTTDEVVAAALRQAGAPPEPAASALSVVGIVARATGPQKTAFDERVVMRFDPQNTSRPFEILQRERLAK